MFACIVDAAAIPPPSMLASQTANKPEEKTGAHDVECNELHCCNFPHSCAISIGRTE